MQTTWPGSSSRLHRRLTHHCTCGLRDLESKIQGSSGHKREGKPWQEAKCPSTAEEESRLASIHGVGFFLYSVYTVASVTALISSLVRSVLTAPLLTCPERLVWVSCAGCTHAYNYSVVPHCCKARPIFLDGHRVSVVTAQFCVTATGDEGNEGQGWVPIKLYLYDRLYLTRLWSAVAKGMTYKPLHLLISFSCIFISLTHCKAFLPHSRANSSF